MKINRDNYEIWFLDYTEEMLTREEMEMVQQFLLQHPDLADELENFAPALIADPLIVFPQKAQLTRAIYDDPLLFESTCVAAMEGDLTGKDLVQFEAWLENRPQQLEFVKSLKYSKLKPNHALVYPHKEKLKRKTVLLSRWTRAAAVAAILLVLLFLFYPETKNHQTTTPLLNAEAKSTIGEKIRVKTAIEEKSQIPLSTDANKPKKPSRLLAASSAKPSQKITDPVVTYDREFVPIGSLLPKPVALNSDVPIPPELVPLKLTNTPFAANEIQLSNFLQNKLNELKDNDTGEFISRQEVALAGLHLFSRIPGKHLTGRKGSDGRLKTISFQTQLLAFSIPVNR